MKWIFCVIGILTIYVITERKVKNGGVRNGPPYPLEEKKDFTTPSAYVKIKSDFVGKSIAKRKTVKLSSKEYAHVMSEIATNLTNEQREKPTFIKYIGNYVYMVENNFDNTYRIIGKKKIK